jgi:hypothetical protein
MSVPFLSPPTADEEDAIECPFCGVLHSLLVQHDWAAVMGRGESGAEWRLPYPTQCFELQLAPGWRVCAFCGRGNDGGADTMKIVLRMPDGESWVSDRAELLLAPDEWSVFKMPDDAVVPDGGLDGLIGFVFRQVRAVAIMLDAQVAEAQVVRAPYKPNREPTKREPLPSFSHHIVTLSRRPRPMPLAVGERGHGTRKRLHFRRGHWRHFETHKTWINWMLVGDPDLGFVDKEYRL